MAKADGSGYPRIDRGQRMGGLQVHRAGALVVCRCRDFIMRTCWLIGVCLLLAWTFTFNAAAGANLDCARPEGGFFNPPKLTALARMGRLENPPSGVVRNPG